MNLGLKDKIVVILGGTSGIGEELALTFARLGSRVIACGRSIDKINNINKKFSECGLEIDTQSVDVKSIEQLKQLFDYIDEKYKTIDVLINNTGTTVRKGFVEYTEDDWSHVVDTNLKAVYFSCVYGSELMKDKGGVIINTSSFTSVIPTCGSALYSATKSAVDTLTAVFAAELAVHNIRVVSVQPGMTITPLTEEKCKNQYDELVSLIASKKLAVPKDIVGIYVFLATDYASYINGISVPVAGGKLIVQNPHYSYLNYR